MAKQFVCVRLQSMNGRNIGLFQFEYDLTWMAFFMDAEDRFYARYGGREDADPDSYLTRESLARLMKKVVDLHELREVQTSRYEPKPGTVFTPEDIPAMATLMKPRKEGNRCIHCHDVKSAQLLELKKQDKFTKDHIFSYPVPSTVGLLVDSTEQNRIREVKAGSAAARSGMKTGDVVLSVDGQRILTVADFSRVLQLTPDSAVLPVSVQRDGKPLNLKLALEGSWRRTEDPAWRSSTHWAGPNGGFWGQPLNATEKQKLGLPADVLALRINFFFKNHPTPQKSGLRAGDVLVEFDGKRKPMNPRQIHAHLQINRTYGDRVPIAVLRDGKEVRLTLDLPDKPTWDE